MMQFCADLYQRSFEPFACFDSRNKLYQRSFVCFDSRNEKKKKKRKKEKEKKEKKKKKDDLGTC